MAIKVTTGQQTFVKKIVVGTPISTAQTDLSIDNFSDFKVSTKSDGQILVFDSAEACLLYTSPSPRDCRLSRMPSSA